jgi:hypothetical protein
MGTPSTPVRNLSKSKLLAFRQCPKRLWLELHRADLQVYSRSAEARFAVGHQVGAIARRLYDPEGKGSTIEVDRGNVAKALEQSAHLLQERRPIFEAGFAANGAMAFADVLLPSQQGPEAWRMIEVKSSASVKPHYHDDVAVQAFAAQGAGVVLESVALAHIDSSWIYPGDGDYAGLLVEKDLTEVALDRGDEVRGWLTEAQAIAALDAEPEKTSGAHCHTPFSCGFLTYCQSGEPQAEFPVSLLPDVRKKALKAAIAEGARDLRDIPDDLLNELQLRVKQHTLSGEVFFDQAGAAAALAAHPLPALFLDFETVQFTVPIWKGTRPYQQICFQFSLHRMADDGTLSHRSFLDLSGQDPSRAFAEALVSECDETSPIFVYNAAFEKTRIAELGCRFPDLSAALLAINARVVDLHPITHARYYHPSQEGSWSIKNVTPAIAPDLAYHALDGVQDGGMAMEAFQEAIAPSTSAERRAEIERQLLAYCALDTLAMVRLWQHFMGRGPVARHQNAETP